MCAFRNRDFRQRTTRPRRRLASFGAGLEPLESRLCLSVIPVGSPIVLDPQSLAQQQGTANVSIASDANGDFVASWDENPNSFSTQVAVQRFNAQGQPVGNEIQVANFTGEGPQEQSSVAMDSAGDFTVVWNGFDSAGDASGIFMRQFSANGTPLTDLPVLVSPALASGRFTGDPQIAMDPAGDFVVAWTQPHADVDESEGVLAEVFNPQGIASGKFDGAFEVNSFTIGNQYKPGVAMDANGNFIISWLSDGQSNQGGTGVYTQRYKNNGLPIGSEFEAYNQVEGGIVNHPSVAFAPDGGFIIASDSTATDGVDALFTVGRFNASGGKVGQPLSFNDDGVNAGTAVAFDSTGEAFFVRSSDGDIIGQLISPTNQLDGSAFTIYQPPNIITPAINPDITTLPNEKFLVAFSGYAVPSVGNGVAAQVFADDAGQTPPPTDTLDFADRVGTAIDDSGTKVVTDSQGNIYVAGQTGIGGATRIGTIVQKYRADGTLLWSKTFGPTSGDTTDFVEPAGLVIDSSGDVIIAGTFNSATDFDPGSGAANRTPSASGTNSHDSYILTLDSNGNFVHVTTLGGPGTVDVEITAIGIDAADNIYITGAFDGAVQVGANSFIVNQSAGNALDGFLWKLNPAGVSQWVLQLGNDTTLTAITALAVDPAGDAYLVALAGFGDAVNFDPLGFGNDFGSAAFGTDVVAKYDPTGHLTWADGYNQSIAGTTLPTAVTVDPQGDVYATGIFSNNLSFNPLAVPVVTSGSNPNAFLLKLTGDSGTFTWVRTIAGTAGELVPTGLTIDQEGNIFESGEMSGVINADPGAGLAIFSSDGGTASVISGFDSNGNLVSADLLGGGASNASVTSLAADQFGHLYLTGSFTGTVDFDPRSGTTSLTSAGGKDLFFAKLATQFEVPVPEISVTGKGVNISDGESAPTAANATDFGTLVANSGTATQTFTITNTGNADLHLTGDSPVTISGTDPGDFSIVTQPATTTIPAGGTATFTVQFAPTGVNTRTATIAVASDDPTQPQFTFEVQGFGQQAGGQGVLSVTLGAAALPATLLPGEKVKVAFTVTNVGDATDKASVPFTFYFGPGDTLDTSVDLPIPGFTKSINLIPGKSTPLSVSFTVPATIDPGDVRLFIVPGADPAGASAASSLVWQFGTVAGKTGVKLVLPYVAAAGAPAVMTTFSLTGNGTGQVIPGDDGVWDLTLTGTDTKTAVTITTTGGKAATIRNITDATDLKSFTAKTIDVSGDMTFSGALSTLTIADATAGGQQIEIGGGATTPVTVTLGRAAGLSLTSLEPIKTLTAVEWLDPAETRDTITAPSLASLKITGNKKIGSAGDFDADVLLSDTLAKQTLGSATIAGTLGGSVVRAAGNIGTITVGRLDDATILAGFTATPDGLPSQASDFGVFTLTTLTVKGETGQPISVINSIIAAATISTVTLKDVQLDNGGTPFGVAAETTIKSYTRLVTGGQSVKLKSLKTPTANAEPGDTGDFVVRIV